MHLAVCYYSIMVKRIRLIVPVLLLLLVSLVPAGIRAETADYSPAFSSPYDLIAAVNAVRASHGLPAYSPNSILMTIAQAQSDYAASGAGITHIDALGRRPFQRALDAGYPVAGDLSQGGWFSENIVTGNGMTVDGAIDWWMGSAPHTATILSSVLQDIGAGISTSGNMVYYVIDCGLTTGAASGSTGSSGSSGSPGTSGSSGTTPAIPNTPNADGSIIHIVQPGDQLLAIAILYGINYSDLLKMNSLTASSIIFPGQKIIIRPAYTPTPTQPTLTPTPRFTITPWPTSSPGEIPTLQPTATRPSHLPVPVAGEAVGAIVITALILAALFTLIGRKPQ
jgi:LysM repeat protein